MINQQPQRQDDPNDTSIIVHHADEPSDSEDDDPDLDEDTHTPFRPTSPRAATGKGKDTADKAGVILGIHNVFIVLPQFVVTFLSSVIFYLMEPAKKTALGEHPLSGPGPGPGAEAMINGTLGVAERLIRREGSLDGGNSSPDAVGLIFR